MSVQLYIDRHGHRFLSKTLFPVQFNLTVPWTLGMMNCSLFFCLKHLLFIESCGTWSCVSSFFIKLLLRSSYWMYPELISLLLGSIPLREKYCNLLIYLPVDKYLGGFHFKWKMNPFLSQKFKGFSFQCLYHDADLQTSLILEVDFLFGDLGEVWIN